MSSEEVVINYLLHRTAIILYSKRRVVELQARGQLPPSLSTLKLLGHVNFKYFYNDSLKLAKIK